MPQIQLSLMILAVGQIWALVTASRIVIRAFKKTTWWGLSSLLIPFAYFVFVIKYWKENWKLAVVHLLFIIICIWGIISFLNSGFIQQYFDMQNIDLKNFNLENVTDYLKLLNWDTGI